jgi:hypothetical protein
MRQQTPSWRKHIWHKAKPLLKPQKSRFAKRWLSTFKRLLTIPRPIRRSKRNSLPTFQLPADNHLPGPVNSM